MASSPKLISILFLFAFFSMQIHAREFFSKIPSVNNNEKETTTTTTNTREQEHETFIPETTQKTNSFPNKEEQSFMKQEQEPRFIPETQNGYGLYGHESGQLPPSTTTKETYEPYVTPVRYHPDEPYNAISESSTNNNNKNTYYNKNSFKSNEQQNLGEAALFTEKGWSNKENQNNYNNRNTYYNKNSFESSEQKNLGGEAMFTEKGWSNKENQNNYNNRNTYYNKNSFEPSEQQNLGGEAMFTEKGWSTKENQNNNNNYNGNINGYNNGEKQGMSDTRYLENGKYYFDVKSENNYYPNQFENSRGVASRNQFNENRYNNKGKYNQNQEEFEEEEEFEP